MTTTPLPLSMARTGVRLRITAVIGGCGLLRKVTEMGLSTGTEIEIRQQDRGCVVVCRGQTRYAVGAGIAHKIMVEIA